MEDLKEVTRARAYQRLNEGDWREVNKMDKWYQEQYKKHPSI